MLILIQSSQDFLTYRESTKEPFLWLLQLARFLGFGSASMMTDSIYFTGG